MKEKTPSIPTKIFNFFSRAIGKLVALSISFALFFLIAGLFLKSPMHFFQVIQAPDANGNMAPVAKNSPVVLHIPIKGIVGTRGLNSSTIEQQLIQSQSFNQKRGGIANGRVKAILLSIDSPGGGAIDSYKIYESLMNYKEKYQVPIYAYIDGICASGGMMIACAADKILSMPAGIVGSVGVLFGPKFNFSTLMEKYGIEQMTLTRGIDKDSFNPYRPWKKDEGDNLISVLDANYEIFVDLVANARPRLSKHDLVHEYGAHIFIAEKGERYGYIDDGSASYKKSLKELTETASIHVPYEVLELRPTRPFFSDFIDGCTHRLLQKNITHTFELPGALPTELHGKPLFLYDPTLTN